MVVRIVHGQTGSLYSTLAKGSSSQNTPEQQKEVQGRVANSAVAQKASVSDAVKVTLSSAANGHQVTQMVRMSGDAVVSSLRSTRATSGGERIETFKEAKEVSDDVAKRMHDEPGQSMQAHDLDPTKGPGLR